MFGHQPYVRDSPEPPDHIESLDNGLDELEETLDNLSETLTLSNLHTDPGLVTFRFSMYSVQMNF